MNPAPSLQGSLWNGNQQLATKKQLISSISGLYADIQDIELSTIKVANLNVSTLTAQQYISTPELYVSSIIGGGIQVNNGLLQISTGDFSFVSLSTLQLKGIDLGGINISFDLGLGNAISGFLGGLGALVGGAFIGIGTGVGLAVQGLETGLATLINGRGENVINNNTFETINGSTQLQISTLGNAFPLYSSITRSVSSVSANEVPGQEIFISTFFLPGTTCIRSVSDPLSIITGDSNLVTSTIQSFGQWVPFIDPTPTGEDTFGRNATFSTFNANVPLGGIALNIDSSNASPSDIAIYQFINMTPTTNSYNTTSNALNIANSLAQYSPLTALTYGNNTLDFISTPYNQYTSTIGNYTGGVYFIQSTITSSLTTIPKFIYNGSLFGGANFAVCEPDETGFLSTGTMDLVAQSSNITFQWGLAVNNLNSTIASGTSKRVSWDIPANTSNFIDIPVPQSTIVANTFTNYQMKLKPFEIEIDTIAVPDNGSGGGRAGMAFNINRATFGEATTFLNQPNYPYQFNNNVFVNGILEAETLISLSSFVSTNIVTFFSTTQLDADFADIEVANISSLQTNFIGGDGISSFGIEVYNALTQFTYVSTLVVDFQIFEGTTGGVTTNLNKIQATTGGSFVRNYTLGSFSNFSTNNLSTGNLFANNPTFSTINLSTTQEIGLTNIFNYPGAITAIAGNNTAPVVGIGFKAQLNLNDDTQTRIDYNFDAITGTSNGSVFYPLATFDPTQPTPYLWDIGNIQNAIMSNATIDNAYISTLNLSSINASNASYSNMIVGNLQVSTINNENSSTLLQYLSMPNADAATAGSPGVWLQWIDLTGIRQNIRNCPSVDLNIGCIAVGADNPPNGGMTGYIGVREKGAGSPLTYKVLENRTIYAGTTPALYGGDITFALQKGIDYSANASTMTIWVQGAANNPYFRTGGYASNAFIRAYPY